MHVCEDLIMQEGKELLGELLTAQKINSSFLQKFIMRKLHYQIVNDFAATKTVSRSEISLT